MPHQNNPDGTNHLPGFETERANRRKLWWAFLINFIFMVLEVAGGLISGSLALLADAGHMLTDVAGLALAIAASSLAGLPPTPKRTFGFLRAEVVGAFLNGASLVVIVGFILWGSWQRLGTPQEINGPLMLAVALCGLAANLASALILFGGRKHNLNLQGAFLHMLGDTLGSVGALAAGLVIWLTGWTPIDTLTSLAIGMIILWGSLSLLRKSLNIIINATPEDISFEEVRTALLSFEHFDNIHDLHIWNLASGFPVLSVHVSLKPTCSDSTHWKECLQEAQTMLRDRFGILHTTLQLEPSDYEKDDRPL